ncbi:MAG: hypothetical protein L0Z62_33710 [Gemmataceae bacterium]|nr:hypothetical protein [Gemmataceae bacterium]
MKYLWFAVLAAVGLCGGLVEGTAQAQGRISRPTVSPYLNLTRRDSNPAINYYNLVRPEFAFRKAIGQLEQQSTTTQQTLTDLQTGESLPATGHPVAFQSHLRYFQNLGATRSPTTARPAVAAPTRPPSRGR